MDITQLQYAQMVVETQNFSRAAEALHITQSGLSQQIIRLERELGFPLFKRSRRGVQPTPQGARFMESAQVVLAAFETLRQEAVALRRAAGRDTVLVGNSTIYRPGAADALALFMERHPEITLRVLDIWEGEMAELLRRGELDVGLFGVDHAHDDLSGCLTIPIQEERVVTVVGASHPFAGMEAVPVEEIVAQKLIFAAPQTGVRRMIRRALEARGQTLPDAIYIHSIETRLHYVARGMGITFSMDATLPAPLRPDVCAIPLAPPFIRTYTVGVSHRMQTDRPEDVRLLKAFIGDFLRERGSG